MCTCTGSCSCGAEFIVNEQIAGPTGATGLAGTTIIYWNTDALSTVNTGVDVLLLSTTISLANTLTTDGSEYQVEITGRFVNNSDRAVKIDLNASTITTVCSNSGTLTDGRFVINGVITRVSNTSTEGFNTSATNLGSTQQFIPATNSFVPDFSTTNSFRVYVNQSVASSIFIDSVKIRRAIK